MGGGKGGHGSDERVRFPPQIRRFPLAFVLRLVSGTHRPAAEAPTHVWKTDVGYRARRYYKLLQLQVRSGMGGGHVFTAGKKVAA